MALKHNVEDYIGKHFGKWLVLGYSHYDKKEHYWKVKCYCGEVFTRRSSQLINGRTQSCRTCAAIGREAEKSTSWKGKAGISIQYINKLKFTKKIVSVTLDDIIELWQRQNGRCAYTGVQLSLVAKDTKWSDSTASLDRIDSSIGYTKENLHWVHKNINLMKMNLKEERFIELCHLVASYRKT